MPTTENIAEAQIQENLARAFGEVFKTMLKLPVELEAPAPVVAPWPRPARPPGSIQVVGSVGFVGEANGVVYLWFDEPSAQKCTGSMLGLDPAEVRELGEEPVNDAVGELANMIVGSFKNGLCEAGYQCKLTIPTILRGTDCHVAPSQAVDHFAYSFASQGHRIAADVVIKAEA